MSRTRNHYDQLPMFTPESSWKAPDFFPTLIGEKRICIDVETCDPDLLTLGPGVRRGAYIAGLAVAIDGGPRLYYPVRHQGGGNIDARAVFGWAREQMNGFTGEVVGANLLYDLDFLAEAKVTFPQVKRFLDVQVAEPLLDEHRIEYNLDALATDYLGVGKDEALLREAAISYGLGTTNKAIKSNIWRLPAKYAGIYGEGDVDRPLRILPMQLEKLQAEGLMDVFDMESRLIPILLAMRRRGVRIDTSRTDSVRARLVKERNELLSRVRRVAGPSATFMAPESFAEALTERGLHFPLTGKTRKPSITKEWLKAHQSDELVGAIMAGRRVDTIITTFIDGHVGKHLINGRIHCEFNQLKGDEGGTIARFSSSNPNLQNIPARDEELGPLVRGLFVAEEGEIWAKLDESQIEYRLLAHFARGPGADEARNKYNTDPKTDFHKMCAIMASLDPNDKFVRKGVKTINFCKVYGGGVGKIAATWGVGIDTATEFSENYDRELPFVKRTLSDANNLARRQGFVRTIMGRKQRFPLWEPADNYSKEFDPLPRAKAEAAYPDALLVRAMTYAALNRIMQGSAADLMKKAMVDAWDAGVCNVLGAFLVTVHDELGLSKPQTPEGDQAVATVKECMEQAIKLRVPVIAELEEGVSWGDCK